MNAPFDLIAYYSRLLFQAEVYQASGRRVPTAIQSELYALEAHGRATLSPQQLGVVQDHVNVAKANFHKQLQTHMQQENARKVAEGTDALSKEVTSGLLGRGEGLTAAQYREVNRTGKVTFPSKRLPQHERDAIIREQTKAFDPKGVGYTEKVWADRMDAIADASAETRAKYADYHRMPHAEMEETAKKWQTQRFEYGMDKRMQAKASPEPVTRVADDSDKRRLAVTNAYLHHASNSGGIESPDDVPRDWLESGGVRGALAKAVITLRNKPPESSVEQSAET